MSPLFAELFFEKWDLYQKIYIDPMPHEKLPAAWRDYAVYACLGLGALLLLICLIRLLKLRIFRFLFGVIAALLVAYYPVAYGVHWYLFKHNPEREKTSWEQKLESNLTTVNYGVMGGGVFLGLTLFYLTSGGKRKRKDDWDDDQAPPAYDTQPQPQPQQQQPQQRRGGGGGRQSGKDPFDFR